MNGALRIDPQAYKKVVWQETPQFVRVMQGVYSDEGDFVRVKGDFKEVLIRKDRIISIENKQARGAFHESKRI